MDVVFNCSSCGQELAAEDSATGEEIQCPSCSHMLVIPPPDRNRVAEVKAAAPPPASAAPPSPAAAAAAAKAEHHRALAVPQHEGPAEKLVKRAADVVAVDTNKAKHLRTKCIKRNQCVEVGHDRFDEVVSSFLEKVGDENVVSINPLGYGYMDTTGHMLPDYGVMIVYRG